MVRTTADKAIADLLNIALDGLTDEVTLYFPSVSLLTWSVSDRAGTGQSSADLQGDDAQRMSPAMSPSKSCGRCGSRFPTARYAAGRHDRITTAS